jgi:hypothetical protein
MPEDNVGEGAERARLETLSQKQLSELERCVRELLAVLRKTRVADESLVETLRLLEHNLGEVRRVRFDESNPEYKGY